MKMENLKEKNAVIETIIAACGNDCAVCPRYTAHPYEKSDEELHRTAELWMKIGYRDHVVSNEEIACHGCKPENWCRYRVVKCCEDRGIKTCGTTTTLKSGSSAAPSARLPAPSWPTPRSETMWNRNT